MSDVSRERVALYAFAEAMGGAPDCDPPENMVAAMAAALAAADLAGWQATHRHRKGGLYRVIARGEFEADLKPCVIYDDAAGRVWVRPATEFDDGRFVALPPPPPPGDAA